MSVFVRAVALALPLAVGLACSSTHAARTARAGDTVAAVPGHDAAKVVSGTVNRVSSDSIAIEDSAGRVKVLDLAPQTVFSIGGASGTASDLREGQEVRAAYGPGTGGRDVAVKIASAGAATIPGGSPESHWATGGMNGGSGGASTPGRTFNGIGTPAKAR